ncbi:GTP 3',8-cyclase MoaA [Calidifontibacillus oryziterrae]|uniref:GTP 3',8-cyclase MoaA n=1 Tax=Calidifontibacillus oryziterrae TaxID=1191699 RepID=UPI000307AD59|nr:GTP 3',8-cyclase MoaA [Calidifontibacillus oryziterrae]
MNKETAKILDTLKRPLRDLRISVIDQCNFRCAYCMPKEIFGDDYAFLPKNLLLTFDEIERLTKRFALIGVEKIRLTGGEPLLRKDLPLLINRIKLVEGIKDIALTTNGVHLAKQAQTLRDAGLDRVNVSLDALDDELFGKINGRNVSVKVVLKGIEAAQKAGLVVKVNMVVKKGMNDQQILPMARYFKEKNINLRFIEFMDVGNSNGWNLEQVVSKKEIVGMISKEIPVEPVDPNYFGEVASRYKYTDCNAEFGVISSVTDSFCSSCTRARLSADGKMYTCLFAEQGFDLKNLMRNEISDEELLKTIINVWEKRTDRYSDERMEITKKGNRPKSKIEMSYIGG